MSERINAEPAFLLSSQPWRESSLWIEIFSRQYGRVGLIARSARKRQSDLRGVLSPCVPLQLSWYGRDTKTLHAATWVGGWPAPQARALMLALYVNELVHKLTAREDPNPQLYDVLHKAMHGIATQENFVLRGFEWRLLQTLGFAPDITVDAVRAVIDPAQLYWMRSEHAPELWRRDDAPMTGIVVPGRSLQELAQQPENLSHEAARDLLRLNRMLLDFRLPEGIASRRILQQLQAFTGA